MFKCWPFRVGAAGAVPVALGRFGSLAKRRRPGMFRGCSGDVPGMFSGRSRVASSPAVVPLKGAWGWILRKNTIFPKRILIKNRVTWGLRSPYYGVFLKEGPD